jgi:hypothetical protein
MEVTPLDLLIMTLATWRVSYMLTKETGPKGLFNFLRRKLARLELLNCIYCVSVWIAAGCLACEHFNLTLILYPFAISGAAMMLRSYTGAGLHDV